MKLMTFFKKSVWLEVIILVGLLPAIRILLGMDDPFFLESLFPWLAIPLTLIALRHGTATAFAGLVILLVGLWFYQSGAGIPLDTAQLYPLSGMAILTLLSGEITNYWKKQLTDEKKQSEETSEHIRQITQRLHISQISHAQLESELMGVSRSLKGALAIIKNGFPQGMNETQTAQWLTRKMTEILSSYSWLESAAFLDVDRQNRVHHEAIAHIGGLNYIDPDDRLIRSVIKTGKAIWVKKEALSTGAAGSTLVAAIPIYRNQDHTHITMILAIRHIRFNAYTQQNLNTLNVLCSWLGDMMNQSLQCPATTSNSITVRQDNPNIQHIHAFLKLWSGYKKSIFLLVARIPGSLQAAEYQSYFGSLARGDDQQWKFTEGEQTTLLIALPLLTPAQVKQYKGQVEEGYYKRFSSTPHDNNISIETIYFNKPHSADHLLERLAL